MNAKESCLPIQSDVAGRLTFIDARGERHDALLPVRAFPLSAPQGSVSLVDDRGQECLWIPELSELPPAERQCVEAALAEREFVPKILTIEAISGYSLPSEWRVRTDRGETTLTLKAEEDIRRLSGGRVLVASASGVQFLIPDVSRLDRMSRRNLDHCM